MQLILHIKAPWTEEQIREIIKRITVDNRWTLEPMKQCYSIESYNNGVVDVGYLVDGKYRHIKLPIEMVDNDLPEVLAKISGKDVTVFETFFSIFAWTDDQVTVEIKVK